MAARLGGARPQGGAGTNAQKPSMTVTLDRHYNSKVYTSGSKISGNVEILSPYDVEFDDVEIVFTGVSTTRLDCVQQFTSHSWRPFMKLRMPLEESDLPESMVFRGGQRYFIPFNFVVPHHLTIGACSHNVIHEAVQQEHLRMPPSVGCWEFDDMAPEMAQIQYAIKARVTRNIPGLEEPLKLMLSEHVVKVIPASPEDAPLDINAKDERYKMAKSKTIRKGIFSAKTGKLTVDTAQPSAIMLSADCRHSNTSTARINLQFVPDSSETAPPKINSVTSKVQAMTFFSGGAVDHLPNFGSRTSYHPTPSLNYTNTVNLATNAPLDPVKWTKQNVQLLRRDSGYSSYAEEDATESDASDASAGVRQSGNSKVTNKGRPTRYVSTVDIPFTLPTAGKKLFLPSFHNCLISRVYALQLTLSVGPTNTTIQLVLPLQVGVETLYEPGNEDLPSFESAMAEAESEVDEFFQPRLLQVPQRPVQRNALPGYDAANRQTIAVA